MQMGILKWDSDLGDQVIEDVVKTLYTDIIHYADRCTNKY